MNKILVLLFIVFGGIITAQNSDYYTKKGFAIEGYDVVSYFSDKPEKGNKSLVATYDDINYIFSSQKNLDIFKSGPTKYIPQYGGYCAYAVANKGKKVSVDPETYEIRNGKLYLFYNAWGTNTLELWNKESPKDLIVKADENWSKIIQ